MATFRFVIADVFTDVPLAGNQLAVFTDARGISEEQLQPLAREINFSETVFVYPSAGDGHARIRIFTPALELPFAGHPVLGTAFVLGGPLQLDELLLETGAGVIPVWLERDGSRIVFGRMRQPAVTAEPYEQADELLALLGVEQSGLPVELYRQGPGHVYVELASPDTVAALRPDLAALLDLSPFGTVCFARDGERWKAQNAGAAATKKEEEEWRKGTVEARLSHALTLKLEQEIARLQEGGPIRHPKRDAR